MSGNGREDIQLKMERSFPAGVLLSEHAAHMSENLYKNKGAKTHPADYFEFAVKQRYGRIGTIAFRGDLGTCTFYGGNRESETIESPF